jgi:hypothetical protein
MKTKKLSSLRLTMFALVFAVLISSIYSCNSRDESYADNKSSTPSSYSETSAAKSEEQSDDQMAGQAMADSIITNQEVISSSAAVVSKDTTRKFIRTADLKFRVKDARWSTLKVEDIVGAHKGFVEFTELRSETLWTQLVAHNEDSSLEIIHYRVVNNMTLRVPNTELDSTLRAIGKLAEFLDFRVIKAENVTLSIKEKQLAANRLKKYDKRVSTAIDNKGNRLSDITDAEENRLNRQEQSDNNLIEELTLQDKIEYSTIQIEMYQRSSTMKTIVESEKEVEPFKESFGTRLMNGVKTGWKILEFIVLAIVNTWSIILIIAAILFAIRYFIKRKKK